MRDRHRGTTRLCFYPKSTIVVDGELLLTPHGMMQFNLEIVKAILVMALGKELPFVPVACERNEVGFSLLYNNIACEVRMRTDHGDSHTTYWTIQGPVPTQGHKQANESKQAVKEICRPFGISEEKVEQIYASL